MNDKINEIDLRFNMWQHRWWQLARTGSLFIAQRDSQSNRLCPICEVEIEDMEHALITCTENPTRVPPEIREKPDPMGWMLSVDRTEGERSIVGLYVRKWWDSRNITITNLIEVINNIDIGEELVYPEHDVSLEHNELEDALI